MRGNFAAGALSTTGDLSFRRNSWSLLGKAFEGTNHLQMQAWIIMFHPQTKLEAVKKSQSFLTDFPEGGLMIQKIKNIHILSMKRYFNFKCSYFISLAAFGITTELCCWVLSVVSLSFQPSLSLGVYFCHAPPMPWAWLSLGQKGIISCVRRHTQHKSWVSV